jgi:uncharacterized membrane protein
MFDWTVVVPTFLAATVEWVEAFTIVLAVSLTIGWRAAAGAAATALMALAVMTAATGGVLSLGVSMHWLQLVIGIASGDWYAGWAIAFKGVVLEGLEVWLIVVALGVNGGWASSAGAAIAALILVATAGLLVRAPLARVPENAMKFAVGAMIVSFGTFWTLESLGGPAAWPAGDWSLPGLVIFYGGGGAILAALLRRPAQWKEVR